MIRFWQFWDIVLAVAVAVTTVLWIKPHSSNDVTTELIAFFAIQSAVILPAMILTAGILRGDGLTIAEVNVYHKALRRQMHFWVTLLSLDFVSVALLIIGKTFGWSIEIPVWHIAKPVNLNSILVGVTSFVVSLCIFRMAPFVTGVISLLDLNSNLICMSIADRERRSSREETPKLEERLFNVPEDYGRIVGPH